MLDVEILKSKNNKNLLRVKKGLVRVSNALITLIGVRPKTINSRATKRPLPFVLR